MIIATGFYSGYLPFAPGTWGSAVGLLLYYFLFSRLSTGMYCLVIAALLIVGIFAAGSAEKIINNKDPGPVVIDEIVGMLITLIAAPSNHSMRVLGFLLFRFFDIVKPFPIRWLDTKIQGGVGIMLDDVVAGIYSFLVLQVVWLFIF